VPDLVRVLDVDGDGTLDIATSLTSPPSVAMLAGLGGGVFGAPQITPLPAQPDALAFADLNGDGLIDLAVSSEDITGHDLDYLLAQSPGLFGPPTEFPDVFYVQDMGLADLDGDGWPDLLALQAEYEVRFFRNEGGAGFAAPVDTLVGAGRALLLDDFNGDERPDAAIYSSGSSIYTGTSATVRVLPNLTSGFPNLGYQHAASFGTPHLVTTGAPVPDTRVSFIATGTPPQSLGALFLGLQFAPTPFAGGTLVPSPDVIVPMQAGVALSGRWPELPAGTAVFAQAWFAAGGNVAGSNAIEGIGQ
jgi:hypothetical protein